MGGARRRRPVRRAASKTDGRKTSRWDASCTTRATPIGGFAALDSTGGEGEIKRDAVTHEHRRVCVIKNGDVFLLPLTAPAGDYCCARF